jgi:hypothetical protein
VISLFVSQVELQRIVQKEQKRRGVLVRKVGIPFLGDVGSMGSPERIGKWQENCVLPMKNGS